MYLQIALLSLLGAVTGNHHTRTNQWPDRSTIVHLFEWKYRDIADECERFLAPKGYGGVQISPPSENLVIHLANGQRTWYERYQVMSYKLKTRSGDVGDFLDMTTRCNKVGVRIYADVVVNHMTGENENNVGTAGSTADFKNYSYPAVPYSLEHFHSPHCSINDYNDAAQVRNCELVGLKDLNQTIPYVRRKIVRYFNTLILLGVAGLRQIADKKMNYPVMPAVHTRRVPLVETLGLNPAATGTWRDETGASETMSQRDEMRAVRGCDLVGLKDLNHSLPYVLDKLSAFLNHLVSLGVAGFRVDAAKHMWPNDLKAIYKRINNLNTLFGFAPNTRPYIFQEVIYYGSEAIQPSEYTNLGDVTEFRVGSELKNVFRGNNALKWLVSWGPQWALGPSDTALVFIDNHDTQRSDDVLTYKESRAYKGAIAFMLAHTYGEPRVMSSFFFNNSDQGPPNDSSENILSPSINSDDTCGNGWVCEHRWRQIYQMVTFRNTVRDTEIQNWWDNGNNQIAFSRGNKGFIAFNLEGSDLNATLQTGLPAGLYCDIITGKKLGAGCTGARVTVNSDGTAQIYQASSAEDMHLAIHVGKESRVSSP